MRPPLDLRLELEWVRPTIKRTRNRRRNGHRRPPLVPVRSHFVLRFALVNVSLRSVLRSCFSTGVSVYGVDAAGGILCTCPWAVVCNNVAVWRLYSRKQVVLSFRVTNTTFLPQFLIWNFGVSCICNPGRRRGGKSAQVVRQFNALSIPCYSLDYWSPNSEDRRWHYKHGGHSGLLVHSHYASTWKLSLPWCISFVPLMNSLPYSSTSSLQSIGQFFKQPRIDLENTCQKKEMMWSIV